MARPTKRTPERVARIIGALENGCTRRAACAVGRIDQATFERWVNRFEDFAVAVKEAEGRAEAYAIAIIRQAMPDQWQAAAWYLERRHAEEWGRKDTLRIEHARILEDTRRLAEERGLDPDAAVAEAKALLGVR